VWTFSWCQRFVVNILPLSSGHFLGNVVVHTALQPRRPTSTFSTPW
jgi:hypothetical protein